MPLRVFLDTEFAGVAAPELLSIGLVAAGGTSYLYMELPVPEVTGRLARFLDDFIRTRVLAQFGRVEGASASRSAMPDRLVAWLNALGAAEVEVIYDFSADYGFIEALIREATTQVVPSLQPSHVGYLLEDPVGREAARKSWEELQQRMGLAQHHALADALALEARFVAVHGAN